MDPRLQQLAAFYRDFGPGSYRQVETLYHADARFTDPVHSLQGAGAIARYFADMGENLLACQFEFTHALMAGDQAFVRWIMRLRHPKLVAGRQIELAGMSRLRYQGLLIIEHEDCYDLGAMVYEQLPLLGLLVRWLRRRLAKAAGHMPAVASGSALP